MFGKSGSFASALDLSSLDGSNGFRIDGAGLEDWSGNSAQSAGDINWDGFDDLIIGAFQSNRLNAETGKSYVVL